jgi:hypothetical protein
VVAHHHAGRAALDRAQRIVRAQHALHQHGQPCLAHEPGECVPGQRGIEERVGRVVAERGPGRLVRHKPAQVRELQSGRQLQVVSLVAVARTQHRRVHREHQRAAARSLGALREFARETTIALHVHLEPQCSRGNRRDVLDARGGCGAQRVHGTDRARAARGGEFPSAWNRRWKPVGASNTGWGAAARTA